MTDKTRFFTDKKRWSIKSHYLIIEKHLVQYDFFAIYNSSLSIDG